MGWDAGFGFPGGWALGVGCWFWISWVGEGAGLWGVGTRDRMLLLDSGCGHKELDHEKAHASGCWI